MQVSYRGFIFIFNFEMADKILKPGSPKVSDCQVTLFTNNFFFKRQQLNINDEYLTDSTNKK